MATSMARSRQTHSGMDRWLLNMGAVLGSLCLVLAAVALVFGIKPLIFTSGSMSPAIPTGSLAMAVTIPASEVSPGEVVSIVTHDGVRLTHRVVSANPSGGLVLKGDGNAVADLHPYTGESVDRVLFSFPGLGYLASWLASPWVFLLGGLLCAYLIYVAFFRRETGGRGDAPGDRDVKQGTRRRTWLGIGAIVTVLALVVPLGVSAKVEATQAAWTAGAIATSNTSAAVMPPPSDVSCGQGANNQTIIFGWAEPKPGAMAPIGYLITVQVNDSNGNPSATNATTEIKPGLDSNSLSLDLNNDKGILGSLLGLVTDLIFGYNYTATVKISARYPSEWTSEAAVYSKVHATNGGLLGAAKKLTCQLH